MKNIPNSPNLSAIGLEGSTFASQLIGVWALGSYIDEQPNGKDTHPFGHQPPGLLIYTADGFFSAQLMKPGRSVFRSADWWHKGTPEEYQEAASGYIGYCGTYEVDEEKATVTHIASVTLLPNLILGPQRRSIDLQGDRLILRTVGVPLANGHFVTSRLEWQRANPINTASV